MSVRFRGMRGSVSVTAHQAERQPKSEERRLAEGNDRLGSPAEVRFPDQPANGSSVAREPSAVRAIT